MIDKKELMLGNWIGYKNTRYLVAGLLEKFVVLFKEIDEENVYTTIYKKIEPLEITEELLFELGFKRWEKTKTYSLKSIILHKRKRGWVIRKSYKNYQYIHQIQNLITNLQK